jgi:EAL domain-containing protein (putative c-di-GMP-specific phosphodiesterase class I)
MTISEPYLIDNNKYSSTMSIGVSVFPRDGIDADTLIRNADIAMYRAKEIGKNNFQFFTDEMNGKVKARLLMENKLRDALEQNQFSVLYQPIASLKTGKITSVEALLRWRHPVHGLIKPSEFLPIAEETGMIVAINNWVLRKACSQLKEWLSGGIAPLQIAVNVSPRQFKQYDFFESVQSILKDEQLDPHSLVLEFTENLIMDDIKRNAHHLQALRNLGVVIAIDNFGNGNSSLKHLRDFPADKLKINSDFIRDINNHAADAAITSAIIALAGKLNLQVVAAGVETASQVKFLVNHHCDEVQGYYFSPPLNKEACTNVLFQEAKLSMLTDV